MNPGLNFKVKEGPHQYTAFQGVSDYRVCNGNLVSADIRSSPEACLALYGSNHKISVLAKIGRDMDGATPEDFVRELFQNFHDEEYVTAALVAREACQKRLRFSDSLRALLEDYSILIVGEETSNRDKRVFMRGGEVEVYLL
jgi:hypothetical protein